MWTPAARRPAANARASPVATARYPWAALIARLFLTLPLVCPRCGADMRLRAFITQAAPVRRILNHIGEPPRISPARGPPAWDDPASDAVPDWNVLAQPQPVYVFDQREQWWPSPVGWSRR
jgi:hypothetical protein